MFAGTNKTIEWVFFAVLSEPTTLEERTQPQLDGDFEDMLAKQGHNRKVPNPPPLLHTQTHTTGAFVVTVKSPRWLGLSVGVDTEHVSLTYSQPWMHSHVQTQTPPQTHTKTHNSLSNY